MVFVASFLFIEGGLALWQQWVRVGCFYHLFEATHARVIGAPPHRSHFVIQLVQHSEGEGGSEHHGSIEGRATCAGRTERVELPRLESAKW